MTKIFTIVSIHSCPGQKIGLGNSGGLNIYVKNLLEFLLKKQQKVFLISKKHENCDFETDYKDFKLIHIDLSEKNLFLKNISDQTDVLISNYYTEKSKYIDNLKLVDIFVGKVIKILNENNNYESSIIIIQGDTGIGKNYINSNIEDRIGSTPLIIKKSYQLDGNVIEDKLLSKNLSKKINKILFE